MNNKNNKNGKDSKDRERGKTDSKRGKTESKKDSKTESMRAHPVAGDVEPAAAGGRIPGRKRANARSRLLAERAVLPVIVGGPWDVGARGGHRIVVRAEYVKRLCVSVRYANLRDQ